MFRCRAELDEVGADDRGEDADRADPQRQQQHRSRTAPAKKIAASSIGRDDRHGVGLEQVGRHAGAVADVVAHVVGDHGRVARVVLGDAGLDLADQVGADVGALGEDAAAEPREDRDQRAAEAERHHRLEHAAQIGRRGSVRAQDEVVAGDAEQPEADHQHAGDGARLERDVEPGGEAAARRPAPCARWRAPIRSCRCSRRARQHGADRKADRDADAQGEAEDDQDQDADDGDRGVLPVQVGAGAVLDGGGDFLHARVPASAARTRGW